MPGAWLILPTYNEAENIEGLVRAALARLETTGLEHTVLVVDDGSPDGTGVIADFARAGAGARPGSPPRAQGGTRTRLPRRLRDPALDNGAELVLEMDADFSHDLDLPRLIAAAEDADLVLGSRYVTGGGVTNWGQLRRSCRAAARPTRAPSWACR